MRKKFVYANGYNISQARKLLEFYFGDFFLKAEANAQKLRFDIYLKKTLKGDKNELLDINDFADLDYFKQYWNLSQENPAFYIMLIGSVE